MPTVLLLGLRASFGRSEPPRLAASGDAREAVNALLVANDFLEAQPDELRAKVSTGYARGRLSPARDRKD